MIRINLLTSIDQSAPLQSESIAGAPVAASSSNEQQKRMGLMKLLLVVLLLVGLNYYQSEYIIKPKKARVNRIRKELREYQKINQQQGSLGEEIRRIREEEREFLERIKVIESLSQNRSLLVKSLDAIQTLIPERVWLTQVQLDGSEIRLKGYSVSDLEISNFIQSLQDSIFFENVLLRNASEAKITQGNFKQFELTCDVREM